MKILKHRLGGIPGHHFFQLLQRGLPHRPDAFEGLEQLLPALLPHPGYFIQNRGLDVAGLKLPVVLNGKAVGLLLDLANQGKDRRDGLDANLPAVRVDQGSWRNTRKARSSASEDLLLQIRARNMRSLDVH